MESEIDHDRAVHWTKVKKGYKGAPDKITEGDSVGLYRFVVECEMVHRETGAVIAACIASCSSMESKYVDRPRDVENTIVKMAEKRAFVGAILLALGLSDEFTQDVEDLAANGAINSDGDNEPGAATDEPEATCPKCKGKMWDNRAGKTNPKAPDFKCRDKSCDGVYWPGQWPPKPKDESQTDAFDSSATEKLTRDSVFPRGPFAGKKVSELPMDFLKWAVGDERNLGDRTPDWQDVFNLEIDERAVAAREQKTPVQEAAEAGPGNAAAALDSNPDKPTPPERRRRATALNREDEIPF